VGSNDHVSEAEWERIAKGFEAPFSPVDTHWRVGAKSKDNKTGLALAFIDSRNVMQRLDDVVGVNGWSDSYEETRLGRVICSLTVCGVTKSDGAGDTKVEGEKGAISDALKRAAVKFGIGRYLYSLDSPWVKIAPRGNSFVIAKGQTGILSKCLSDHYDRESALGVVAKNVSKVAKDHAAFDSPEEFYQWVSIVCDRPIEGIAYGGFKRIVEFLNDNPKSEDWSDPLYVESLKEAKVLCSDIGKSFLPGESVSGYDMAEGDRYVTQGEIDQIVESIAAVKMSGDATEQLLGIFNARSLEGLRFGQLDAIELLIKQWGGETSAS
jgi:hypothetical protein